MEEKKFYKNIQQKIDQADFEPIWNQAEVWQRIEQKQGKRITPFVWWQAVAASIVLLGGIGVYFLKNNSKITDSQLVAVDVFVPKVQTNVSALSKSIHAISVQTKGVLHISNDKKVIIETPENVLATSIFEPQIAEKAIAEVQEKAVSEEKTAVINQPVVAENLVQETNFVAHPALLEKRVPRNRERIAILEIPEDDESYNIPRKEKNKSFMARLVRKKGRNNTEENEELPSINGKPNKVWAFVKESFKNETMATDSTNK
jgi:hypothetical protein